MSTNFNESVDNFINICIDSSFILNIIYKKLRLKKAEVSKKKAKDVYLFSLLNKRTII